METAGVLGYGTPTKAHPLRKRIDTS